MHTTLKTIAATILLFGFGTLEDAHSQSFVTNGLVAYFPFNGNANDESGHGNNCTFVEANLAPARFGQADKAMLFIGSLSSNLVVVPKIEALDFNKDFTLSLWVNVRLGGSLVYTLMSGGPDNSSIDLRILPDWTPGKSLLIFGWG